MKTKLTSKVINDGAITEAMEMLKGMGLQGQTTLSKKNVPHSGSCMNIRQNGQQVACIWPEKVKGEKVLYLVVPSYSILSNEK
jgi:hypothetical protein